MPAIRSKFPFAAFALLSAGLLACGGDSTGPDSDQHRDPVVEPSASLSGAWDFTSTISLPDYGVTGNSQARLQIQHRSGQSTITGTYTGDVTWSGPGGTITEGTSGSIQGSYTGSSVSFRDDGECAFDGTLSQGAARMQGSLTCPDYEGTPVRGSWTATRLGSD